MSVYYQQSLCSNLVDDNDGVCLYFAVTKHIFTSVHLQIDVEGI